MQVWKNGNSTTLDLVLHKILVPTKTEKPFEFGLPPGSFSLVFWEGEASAIQLSKDNHLSLAQSKDLKTWASVFPIQYNTGDDFPTLLHPTSKPGLYLGAHFTAGFSEDNHASILAWYKQSEKGEISFFTLVNLELDGPLFRSNLVKDEQGKLQPGIAMLLPSRAAFAPFFNYPIRIGQRFLIVSLNAGVIWILEDGDARPKRTVKLVDLTPTQMSGLEPIERCILGLQPTPEGKLLLACRTEEAVKEGAKAFNTILKDNFGKEDEILVRAEQEKATRVFGRIRWLELDPETGKVERVFPPGSLDQLQSFTHQRHFQFLVKKDGTVAMGEIPMDPQQGMDVPSEAKASSPSLKTKTLKKSN